ncbi:MAG: ABC transporter permease [Bacteroidetes bacterium]|nr:MAG: ABC transporter permease [Bacteroidota bacterium]REK05745.1 MAG: ABC transporter permease [Bacteroidota bacterium]REK31949.1 MAG: ABC transporter permease [Bacteroidota bacterium]REK50014.1 MAG: ABC transporter permease [Bacteroidota bacterium]
MNLPFFIAKRYFLSPKSQKAINIISMISVTGVTIGTAALIVVLSVFNGFEGLVMRLYNSFDPDLKISLVEGKKFSLNEISLEKLRSTQGVAAVAEILEENALVKYEDRQTIVTLKGVGDDYEKVSGVDTMLIEGNFQLKHGDLDFAVPGGAIAYNLGLNTGNLLNQMEVYAPRRTAASLLNPEEAFNRRFITTSGVFSVQQEFDTKYIIVPIRFTYEILEEDMNVSSLEISVIPGADIQELKKKLKAIAGNRFEVKDRFEQHELIYKIMKSEKWAVFLILTFILIIATFNVVSSLTMLVIEKKKDIAILSSMGAGSGLLRRIFLIEGLFITMIGAFIGLIIGFAVCFAQEKFGLITLGGSGSFVIDAYPVEMELPDFFYVLLTVFLIGLIAAWYPAKRLIGDRISLRDVKSDE